MVIEEIKSQEIEDNQIEEESLIINDYNPSIASYCMNPSDYYNRTLFHYVGGKTNFFDLMDPPYIKE